MSVFEGGAWHAMVFLRTEKHVQMPSEHWERHWAHNASVPDNACSPLAAATCFTGPVYTVKLAGDIAHAPSTGHNTWAMHLAVMAFWN